MYMQLEYHYSLHAMYLTANLTDEGVSLHYNIVDRKKLGIRIVERNGIKEFTCIDKALPDFINSLHEKVQAMENVQPTAHAIKMYKLQSMGFR